MKAVLQVPRVLTAVVAVIGVGTVIVTGVGIGFFCIVFSILLSGDHPHYLSSFLNLLRPPSPPAVLPVDDVFPQFFSFCFWLGIVRLILLVWMLLLLMF